MVESWLLDSVTGDGAMPTLISPAHSVRSDGFPSIAAGFHAVYHFVLECHYLGRIEPHNLQMGIGVDRLGRPRIECSRCVVLSA